jgi:hypothetical protein
MTFIPKDISIKDRPERFDDLASFPNRGNERVLYLANDTGVLYQWDGSAYQEIKAASSGAGTPYEPNVVTKDNTSSPYTTQAGEVVLCAMSLGDVTVVLPPAPANKNAIIVVKKLGSSPNKVVIDGDAAETIDGSLTITIRSRNNSYTMICDGAAWFII